MEFQSMSHVKMPAEAPKEDSLFIMLTMQRNINRKIYPIVMESLRLKPSSEPAEFTMEEREAMTKEYLLAIIRECSEALDLINSKPWKIQRKSVNERELYFEFIDIQHFLNSLYDIWGLGRDEVLKIYIAKNKENHARVERGY